MDAELSLLHCGLRREKRPSHMVFDEIHIAGRRLILIDVARWVPVLWGGTEQGYLRVLRVGQQRCAGRHIGMHERGAIQIIQDAYDLIVDGVRVFLLPIIGQAVRQV